LYYWIQCCIAFYFIYVSGYKKAIVGLPESNMQYVIRTEKKKEKSKNHRGLSILFNSSIPEIKITSIRRD